MVLCRYLFLTLVFRYLNPDIISIPHTVGHLKHKSELLLPHGCKACSWHGVTPSGWEKPSFPLKPRPNLSAALGTNSLCDPQHEPNIKERPVRALTKSPHMGRAKPLYTQSSPVFEFSSLPPVPGALLWNHFLGETHEPENMTPPFPQNDPKLLLAGTNPQRGILVHSP